MPFYKLETFDASRSVGYLVKRINALMVPRIEAQFEDAELTFTQWVVLMHLCYGGGDTCAGIAAKMNHDAGALTRIADQMEKRGLLTRQRSTKDRRVVHLKMTAKGKAMGKSLTPRVMDFWNHILGEFTEAEAMTLIGLLSRLNARLDAAPAKKNPSKKSPSKKGPPKKSPLKKRKSA
ncbi:MAG: winged helix-turn-helix transcriptional regulator [Rhodospirillaceae bacterium]|nr:winged helix-turn-helix transcriptional regulator [Rhodospirillaceae bacterium]